MRTGSICTGYGGLDIAAHAVLGGELAWVADNDPGASAILAHQFPSVPNLGDITTADWLAAGSIDVLTAGFPCQDISLAGKRAGLRKGTRSGIWSHVAAAIGTLRPSFVILENVRSLTSAGADSDVEPCAWCLGDSGDEHALRALGAVLGDLADLGFDAEWQVVSASDAGGVHRRERVFILAWAAADAASADQGRRGVGRSAGPCQKSGEPGRSFPEPDDGGVSGTSPEDADGAARGEWGVAAPGQAESGRSRSDTGGRGGAPASDTERDRLEGRQPAGWQAEARKAADDGGRGSSCGGGAAAYAQGDGRNQGGAESAGVVGGPDASLGGHGTAADSDSSGRGPDEHDVPEGRRDADRGASADASGERHGNAGPQGKRRIPATSLASAPADPDSDGLARITERDGEPQAGLDRARGDDALGRVLDWGPYGPAIARWERVTGRPAPRPTEPGRTGERLSPRFVEFMMGLPEGWVTGVPGLSRNAQLKALGNGVVPQQAALALSLLLERAGFTSADRGAA